MLGAILQFFPLDPFVEKPVSIMAMIDEDAEEPLNWEKYREIVSMYEKRFTDFENVERFDFYKG
jgi:L-fucose mutarotase